MAPPLLPFAWIVGILLALCVAHHRKPSKPHRQSPPPDPSRSSTSAERRSPPPGPPERDPAQSRESPGGARRSWGRRGLSLSASARARVPERIAARMRERKERSAEESIWMKTIILGERCRVPSDDESENENGGGGLNGRRPRHYRPRTPRSVPVSRTTSFLDLDDAASSPAFGAAD